MRRLLSVLAAVLLGATTAAAQTEGDLKQHFEGRHVTPKIDVPATKDGVNVYPESARPLEYSGHAAKLKRRGATTPPASVRRVVSVGPRTTFLKEGLSESEVLWLLGSPSLTLRAAGGPSSVTHEFPRGEGRVLVAEFKDGVLVSSRTEARGQAVSAAGLR